MSLTQKGKIMSDNESISKQEIKDTLFEIIEDVTLDDFAVFFINRLIFEPIETLVELYNKEVEIGVTGEKMQTLYFVVFHKLFLRYWDKSPIVLSPDSKSIRVKGKIRLGRNGFKLVDGNCGHLKIVK